MRFVGVRELGNVMEIKTPKLLAYNSYEKENINSAAPGYICSTCINNESLIGSYINPGESCSFVDGRLLIPCIMFRSIILARKKQCKHYDNYEKYDNETKNI